MFIERFLYNIDGTCSENRVPKEKMKELMKMLIDKV